MKYKYLTIGILLTIIMFPVSAQEMPGAPETLEEAKTLGQRILIGFPQALKEPWHEALALWERMLNYVSPWLKSIWNSILSLLGREVEKRKPGVEQEFEKEKQEMKEETLKTGKSLWQRFKELIY